MAKQPVRSRTASQGHWKDSNASLSGFALNFALLLIATIINEF